MKHRTRSYLFTLFLLCAAVFCLAITAGAEESGDWEYRVDDSQITITSYHGSDKALTIPDSIDGCKVVAIGEKAFAGNIDLESVTMPDTITSIAGSAFKDCSSLTEVTLSSALTSISGSAFAASKIKHLEIPDSVTYIGPYAFDGCTGLRSVSIGSGVNEWGKDWGTNAAFRGCTLLTDLTISEGVLNIGTYAFQGCTLLMEVMLPSTITEVGEGAFLDCELLDTVDAYGSLGNSAFENCTSLKNITLHEINTIGSSAFYGDTALKEITIPDTVTSIGASAFRGCTKLQEITIPDSVTYVGAHAFRDCTQLGKAVIGGGITEWGLDWGDNNAFDGCTHLTDLTIRDGCGYIPTYCFQNCTALESVRIPGSCVSIDDGAFRYCSALAEVQLEEGIAYINAQAFNEDSALVKAELPSTLLSIGNSAFHNTRLREVNIPDKVMTIGCYAFSDNPALRTAYIGESVETWNTDWGTNGAFQNDIRLESLEIADGCMYIGSYAFQGCLSLTKAEIPITAVSVDEGAFRDCISLSQVSILRGEIKSDAFCGCTALSDLSIQRVTTIADEAFYGCTALPALELPDTVTSIGRSAFDSCISLSSVQIPESVTYLGAYAFANCTGLLTADISNNITEWGKDWGDCRVFAFDTSLQYVFLDDGANSIGNQLFRDCTALKGVYLPESLVSYETNLFEGCPEDLVIYGKGPKMQALAEELGRNYSTEAFELPVPETVTLTLTAGEGGVIAPSGKIEKPVGSSQDISIIPAFGYMVDTYTVDGSQYDYWETLVDIQTPSVVEVTFTEDPDYVEEYPLLEEPADAPAEDPKAHAADASAENVCANCGYEFPEGEEFAFCPKCGTPR